MQSTQIIRGTGQGVRPSARCRRNTAQSAQKRTRRIDGNGFLNHEFLPFWAFTGNGERIAREYFNSLANLCQFYNIPFPRTDLPFPQNIYSSWQAVEAQIREKDKACHCIIAQHKQRKAVLTTVRTFNLRNGLYYIPVRPYWNLLNMPEVKALAGLTTVIFAYLYQVIGIPFYINEGSFMEYQYDILEEWIRETEAEGDIHEDAKEWREKQEDTLYEMKRAGGHVMPIIKDPKTLHRMENVVTSFHHTNDTERNWELMGIEFLQLYRQYGKRSLSDGIHADLIYPDEEERISYHQYTSFYWSDLDCFENDLIEMVNSNFQEMPLMDEPSEVIFFDTLPEKRTTDFDFENRLFDLIERLRYLLNKYDHEEHHATVQ